MAYFNDSFSMKKKKKKKKKETCANTLFIKKMKF